MLEVLQTRGGLLADDTTTLSYANGYNVTSVVDKYGNLKSVKEGDAEKISNTFDLNNPKKLNMHLDNYVNEAYTYTYDNLNEVTQVNVTKNGVQHLKLNSSKDFNNRNLSSTFTISNNNPIVTTLNYKDLSSSTKLLGCAVEEEISGSKTNLLSNTFAFDKLDRLSNDTISFNGKTIANEYTYQDAIYFQHTTTQQMVSVRKERQVPIYEWVDVGSTKHGSGLEQQIVGYETEVYYEDELQDVVTTTPVKQSATNYIQEDRLKVNGVDAGVTTYTYDKNGNVLTQVYGSKTISYVYDGLNRL
ncbi:MAG: hypothetical protein RR348_04345, partial [Clostridia bacterium]